MSVPGGEIEQTLPKPNCCASLPPATSNVLHRSIDVKKLADYMSGNGNDSGHGGDKLAEKFAAIGKKACPA